LGDRLQPRSQVRFGADDRVVHAIVAAEISNIAKTRIDAHADPERVLDPVAAPLGVEAGNAMLHFDRHAETRSGVLSIALGLRIAKKTSMASPTNLSTVPPCANAIVDISVKYSFSNWVICSG